MAKQEAEQVPTGTAVVRQEFGARELAMQGEMASNALAAQARAAVEARYVMALRRPRDLDEVRVRLLKECKRPGFADVARYHKPVGKGVEGPSIRFAEAAARCMTNLLVEAPVVYDDDAKRQIRVSVTDLESNVTYPIDVVIAKTVERSALKDGQVALKVRTNSYGKPTYLVEATEDDLLNKQNAQISKAARTGILRVLPGDILEECMDQVRVTLADRAAKDPEAERKKLADAFSGLGVGPADLKVYLGHELGTISPAELLQLRALYTAIRDGEASWVDALEAKGKGRQKPTTATPGKPAGGSTLDKLADALDPDAEGAEREEPMVPAEEPVTPDSENNPFARGKRHKAAQKPASDLAE